MEITMPMTASDYLDNVDSVLARQDRFRDQEHARADLAEAQVMAIEAVATALDRLAEAVENLRS
jgi:hypothetical protein